MGKWIRSSMTCRLCRHKHESVYPAEIKEVQNQECPSCRHMTSGPLDLQDEEDSYEQEDWQDEDA